MIPAGFDGKLYHGTAGSSATTELTIVRDVTLGLTGKKLDDSSRGSGKWVSTRTGRLETALQIDILDDPDDPGYAALLAAFLDRTAIALKVLTEDGGNGMDADFAITSFDRKQPLDEIETISITAEVNTALRAPTYT